MLSVKMGNWKGKLSCVLFEFLYALIFLLLLRLFEYSYCFFTPNSYYFFDLLNGVADDLFLAISFSFLLFIIDFIPSIKQQISRVVFSIFVVTNLLLSFYYLTSGRLLGEEIFRYGMNESAVIIYSSISNLELVVFILLLILCFQLIRVKEQIKQNYLKLRYNYVLSIIYVVVLIPVLVNNWSRTYALKGIDSYENEEAYEIGSNKLKFFLNDLVYILRDSSEVIDKDDCACYETKVDVTNKDYPLLNESNQTSTLKPFFDGVNDSTNVVIFIVESLSSSFSGPSNYLGSYTPFLDSLRKVSLVWDNTLSGAIRTYGVLPNVLGGLPYGADNKGIINDANIEKIKYPSLMSVLGAKGYYSSFYYGGWSGFDQMSKFMKVGGIDKINDSNEMKGVFEGKVEYQWGYSDFDMLTYASNEFLESNNKSIDVILTLAIHKPFDQEIKEEDFSIYKHQIQKRTVPKRCLIV